MKPIGGAMAKYIVTVRPDVDGTSQAEAACTTMHIDTSSDQVRITEVTVRAASGDGLAAADLPLLDLELLVRAVTTAAPAQALPAVAQAEPIAARTGLDPVQAPRRRIRKTAARASKTPGIKATRKEAVKATKKAAAESARAYRRMPEPGQVMEVYNQAGSITAVAEHFGVPRHTVDGWARRLRAQGHSIGRQ
jgi:hypothetical protein